MTVLRATPRPQPGPADDRWLLGAAEGDWYRQVVDGSSDALIGIDLEQRIGLWNRAAESMFRYRREEIIGRSLHTLLPPALRTRHRDLVSSFIGSAVEGRGMGDGAVFTAVRSDGTEFPAEIAIWKVAVDGETRLLASVRDVSQRMLVERDLEQRTHELEAILRAMPDALYRIRYDGEIVAVMPGADGDGGFLRVAPGDSVRSVLPSAVAEECIAVIRSVLDDGESIAINFHSREVGIDDPRHFEVRFVPLTEEEVIASVRDVTARRIAEQELRHRAMHDPLTGTGNRAMFQDRLADAMRRAARTGSIVAVLMLDVDHFKKVNDSLGHDSGDRLLVTVADRLRATCRGEDTVARLGGDEFVVLAERFTSTRQIYAFAERLRSDLEQPIDLGDRSVEITASIGIAVAGAGTGDAQGILLDADTALYRAKHRGRNRIEVFDLTLRAAMDRRLAIESSLRRAIDDSRIVLHYQPVFDLGSGEVVGVEALARWFEPSLGPVGPAEFVPVAEEAGLVEALDSLALHKACAQARSWAHRLGRSPRMAVNVSARGLANPVFAERVMDLLASHGLTPTTLMIEVTESAFIDRPEVVSHNLAHLKANGVFVALDDFGTGYGSLTHLRDMPITHVKIDRGFTAGLTRNRGDAAIVEATVGLAHALGLVCIAEGVEEEDQKAVLRDLACAEAQGFLFARPLAAPAVEKLLVGGPAGGDVAGAEVANVTGRG